MNQEKITLFLQGKSSDASDEVERLFKEIQLLVVKHQNNQQFVIDALQSKYGFDHRFCEMVVLCATLYIN